MGHWKRLITIPCGTDCYYCINNMTCLIHVSYYVVVLITVPVMLSTIMLPVDFATLPDTYYTSCGDTLFMYTYTLHCKYSGLCIPYILHFVSAQHSSMSILHAAHLHVQFYHSPLYNIFIISNLRLL